MMEQLLRDLGGKPLASGVFSWWDVGQTPWPCPSSITVRKYLVFKCRDRAHGVSGQPLAISGPRNLPLPERFPRVIQRLVPL